MSVSTSPSRPHRRRGWALWVRSGSSWDHSERGCSLQEHPQAGWPSTWTVALDQASAPPTPSSTCAASSHHGHLHVALPLARSSVPSGFEWHVLVFGTNPHWLVTAHATFSTQKHPRFIRNWDSEPLRPSSWGSPHRGQRISQPLLHSHEPLASYDKTTGNYMCCGKRGRPRVWSFLSCHPDFAP